MFLIMYDINVQNYRKIRPRYIHVIAKAGQNFFRKLGNALFKSNDTYDGKTKSIRTT